MAEYRYEFGKRWDARVPRAAISWLMGRVHVGTPDSEIEANIRRRIAKSDSAGLYTPALVRQSIAYALACHRRNGDLYKRVMSGRL